MTTIQDIKKTKIIATLGPASDDAKTLEKMIANGVDIIRLNASHRSDPQTIKKNVQLARRLAKKVGKSIGIFLDLQGPKIRVGKFKNNKVELKTGDVFTLTTDTVVGTQGKCSVSYKGFAEDVQPGEHLFIDDGKIRFVVMEKTDTDVLCSVERGGTLSNQKGVNLPESSIKISALTEKDLEDVKLAVKHKLNYVALSFVSHPDDIKILRGHLDKLGGTDVQIIAKIERQFAIDHIIPIIDEADGIMVARGDLGVEIGVENVPRCQKMIIHECNRRTKPVIVATQMLESMIYSKTATRAEVSDVANAIYDRCDAVMLSGETAIGVDPVAAINTMANICRASDDHLAKIKLEEPPYHRLYHKQDRVISFCKAADQIAHENEATAIMAFTSSGNTSMVASKLSSSLPIISPTDEEYICQRMAIYRGVLPMMMPKKFKDIHRWTDMIRLAVKEAKAQGLLQSGDKVVVTAGIPIGESRGINSIRLITVE